MQPCSAIPDMPSRTGQARSGANNSVLASSMRIHCWMFAYTSEANSEIPGGNCGCASKVLHLHWKCRQSREPVAQAGAVHSLILDCRGMRECRPGEAPAGGRGVRARIVLAIWGNFVLFDLLDACLMHLRHVRHALWGLLRRTCDPANWLSDEGGCRWYRTWAFRR